MKISELSAVSGVSVASIKYYMREGLLAAGVATATNQADYGDAHVARLRLIRALIDVGALPIAIVRSVLATVDDQGIVLHDAFGAVMHTIGASDHDSEPDDLAAVTRWVRRRRWTIKPDAPAIPALAALLGVLRRFGFPTGTEQFDSLADTAEQTADFEVAYALAMPDRSTAVETMVIGTLVYERIQGEIRRLALEAVSARQGKPARSRRS